MSEAPLPEDLPDDPKGRAQRWTAEFQAARKNTEEWWKRAERVIDRYLDDRKGTETTEDTRLNLFTANTQTMESLLFGKTPQVDVARRFADSEDDEARVAAEMLERLLNMDIEKDTDTQQEAFKNALADRLRAGLGNVRLHYRTDFDTQEERPAITADDGSEKAPAVPATEVKQPGSERVDVEYKYWKDQLWSPCRVFTELRWWAFRNEMSRKQYKARFGKLEGFTPTTRKDATHGDDKTKVNDHLDRCDVWEIWDKDDRCVDWFVEGYPETLDHKDDPLQLEGFWPFPRPMFANLTTSKLMPTPDFALAQDLYDEVDMISTRITILERAIRAVGIYDSTKDGIKRIFSEASAAGNEMIPVDGWAMYADGGGIKGFVDWFPLDMVVNALQILREYRTELIGLLFQVTGMSDIMRGQASQQTTATEQAIKARFASVRVQSLQDEFARFCSDVQKIKAEIISKHFDPQTIIERSNILRTPDAQLAGPAVQLIKSKVYDLRITVNPDSVSLTDFAALKQERMEFAQAISGYFQGMMPFVQLMGAVPSAVPPTVQFVIGLGQELVAGLKASNEMEGIFDQYVAELKKIAAQPPPPPQPNPQMQIAQIKAQAEMGKAQAQQQQTQLDGQVHVVKTVMDVKAAQQKHALEMQKLGMQQQAAEQDHSRSLQSQEGQERLAAIKQVDKVTGEGKA